MALILQSTIRPTKIELLDAWVPTQPWFEGTAGVGLTVVGSYRFDDPADEVGLEGFLVRAGDGPVLHVPVTYRGAPLEGGEPWLITTMDHSVLGPRWVYDGAGDPVFQAVLTTTVLTGGHEAEQHVETDNGTVLRPSTATVLGSGSDTDAPEGAVGIDLVRTPETDSPDLPPVTEGARTEVLTGSWLGAAPRVLARVRV